MVTANYEVQVFDRTAGTERWLMVNAETMRHAQAIASERGFIVGDVRAAEVARDPVFTDAAQGVKGVTWTILALVVFLIVLVGAVSIGQFLATDIPRSNLGPNERPFDKIPRDKDGNFK